MTILQRYGIFIGIPGAILLLTVGLMLVSTNADDEDASNTNLDLTKATVIVVESPEKEARNNQIAGAPANEQPQSDRQNNNTNLKSVAQLAEIAQQANQQAQDKQPDSNKVNEKPALNDLASAPEKNPAIANLPPVPQEVIVAAIDSLKPAAKKCYDTLREELPDAAGNVLLSIVFENEDGMSRVQVSEVDPRTTLHNEDLHNCLTEVAGTLELPQSPTKLTIYHPFIFKPDDSK